MTAVKFCGLTRAEDMREAVRLGVEFVGLNFVPKSPRFVSPGLAAELIAGAAEEARRAQTAPPLFVGVFAPGGRDLLCQTARSCCLDLIQWHGPLGSRPATDLPVIQAVRPRAEAGSLGVLPAGVWAYLVDAYHDRLLGGTGRTANWGVAAELAPRHRLFLAGGLRPENVGAAVGAVGPAVVDVAGGIEVSPGVKDHALMRAFIEEVRRADASR